MQEVNEGSPISALETCTGFVQLQITKRTWQGTHDQFLIYFIPTSVILVAFLASVGQFSLPCYKDGRSSVLYNFIVVFFRVFFGLNTLFIMSVIFR
jgi:hypothetical protein